MNDLPRLTALMDQCQSDTFHVLPQAATRPANWQRHQSDLESLVRFIHDRLLNSRENGYKLEKAGRLSLEAIVAREMPHLFSQDDIEIAKATLAGIV